ncbi:MAG: alanine racemase, partial [Peptococcaceae bacterium]|nr:alanine racemase [Peptococcaceae bacterium]
MQAYRPTWLEINLTDIAHNCRVAKSYAQEDTIVAAVVKANAYGHGAVEVSRACIEAGAGYLVVATMGEAVELREAGIEVPILILGWTPEESFEQAILHKIHVALYDLEEARKLNAKALSMGKKALGHLKIDTGMSRLGMQADETGLDTAAAILQMEGIAIEGMFTHFSKADESDKTFANLQIERFNRFTDELERRTGVHIGLRHMGASAGVMDMPEGHYNMIRPGIMLYGYQPSDEMHHVADLKPALTWKARIGRAVWLPAGRLIGYNGTYELKRDTLVATIPVGYADGYNRLLGNSGYVICRGKKLPIIGKICMDYFMVDATELPDLKTGDEVILLGEDQGVSITVPEMAKML